MQSALFWCIVRQVMATESEKNKVFVKYVFFLLDMSLNFEQCRNCYFLK